MLGGTLIKFSCQDRQLLNIGVSSNVAAGVFEPKVAFLSRSLNLLLHRRVDFCTKFLALLVVDYKGVLWLVVFHVMAGTLGVWAEELLRADSLRRLLEFDDLLLFDVPDQVSDRLLLALPLQVGQRVGLVDKCLRQFLVLHFLDVFDEPLRLVKQVSLAQ